MESSLDNPGETTQSKEQTDSATMDDRVQSAEPVQTESNFEVGSESFGDAPNGGEENNLNDLDGRIQAASSIEYSDPYQGNTSGYQQNMTSENANISNSDGTESYVAPPGSEVLEQNMTPENANISNSDGTESYVASPGSEVDLDASSVGVISPEVKEGNVYSFTYDHEVGTGKWDSTAPHVPKNKSGNDKSGVTIGPGYDMGGRTSEKIKSDLIQAGVNKDVAEVFSTAEGKRGDDARAWINDHANLKITETQQKQLYNSLIPEYEHKAQKYVDQKFGGGTWENLTYEQKAMLFDHTYNLGKLSDDPRYFPKYTEAVVKKDWNRVAQEYERSGADRRNQDFYNEFLRDKLTD